MNLEKLKPSAATAILLAIGVLCNILILIFLNNQIFFLSCDIFKLLIIGIGVTLGICFYNIFILAIIIFFKPSALKPSMDEILNYSSGFALIAVSATAAIKFFFNLSYLGIFIAIVMVELLMMLVGYLFKKEII